MANSFWRPQQGDRPQIDSITVSGAIAAGNTGSVLIGNSTLTVTAQSGTTTTSLFAAALKNAINATKVSGNDAGLVANESRNAAGQMLPEFRDVEAYIDPTNSSRVLVRSRVAGVPFGKVNTSTLDVASTGGGALTLAAASVQTATGQRHWDAAANWTDGVPNNGDVLIFDDGSVGPMYGLPTGTLRVTFIHYMRFSGMIGLPFMNPNGYAEYRQRHVRVDDNGVSGAATQTHVFGLGDGPGSPLINIRQQNTSTSPNNLTTSINVFNTGRPLSSATKALNFALNNSDTSSGTVTVSKGSVDVGQQDSISAINFAVLNVGKEDSRLNDVDVAVVDATNITTINQAGGTLLLGNTAYAARSANLTLNMNGGFCAARDVSTSGNITATVQNSTLQWNSDDAITTLILASGGILDLEKDLRAVTVSSCDLFAGAQIWDKYGRLPNATNIDLNRCGIEDVVLRLGKNRRLTLAAVA